MIKLEFSPASRLDLRQIGDYIAEDNPDRALTFVDELEVACRSLVVAPYRFPVIIGFEKAGYRKRVHGRYLIVYVVRREEVRIVRVLSAAMNIQRLLESG